MTKPENYSLKKDKSGEYIIVESNIVKESSLKDIIMTYGDVQTRLKAMRAQQSLWEAGIKACSKDPLIKKVVLMFEKLSAQSQGDLEEYIAFKKKTREHKVGLKRLETDAKKIARVLNIVQPMLPKPKEAKKK